MNLRMLRATALTVINRRSQALDCTFFFRVKTDLDDYDLPTANGQRSLAPQESFRYDPDRYRVGVLVKQVFGADDIYADAVAVGVDRLRSRSPRRQVRQRLHRRADVRPVRGAR